MNLDFDPATHTYTIDGVTVPSVTQIVSPLGDDYDEPDEFTERSVDAAAERGTLLHDYIAFRLQGGDPEEYEMPDAYEPYKRAVDDFLAEHNITPFAVEQRITNGVVAGTPDLVCEYDGELAILDYKFVSSVAKSKVCAQLGGYLQLLAANDIYPGELYAVQFKADDYRVYPVNPDDAERMWFAAWELYKEKVYKHPRGCIGERIIY